MADDSRSTMRSAEACGAVVPLTCPDCGGVLSENLGKARRDCRCLCAKSSIDSAPRASLSQRNRSRKRSSGQASRSRNNWQGVRRDVIVIGASAGGVEALCRLFSMLPRDLPAIIESVTHGGTIRSHWSSYSGGSRPYRYASRRLERACSATSSIWLPLSAPPLHVPRRRGEPRTTGA